jgi:Family of unknown function (DUF6062)
MPKPREIQALLYACTQEGCPICRQVNESTRHFLDAWKYELFTDAGLREELSRSQGFCSLHTQKLVQMGASLQLAQAYHDIISDTIEQLQANTSFTARPAGGLLRRFFEAGQEKIRCPACLQKERAEGHSIDTLRKALLDDEFYAAFQASDGLCLPHFHLACTGKAAQLSGTWLSLLSQAQLRCLQRLNGQLEELVRKHDYRFKDEERGPEMLSWKKAAGIVAGEEV